MPQRERMIRKNALLAIAVATGMMHSSPPAPAVDAGVSFESFNKSVHSFAVNRTMPSEYRARQLISFAVYLLRGQSSANAERLYLNSRGAKQLSFVPEDGAGMMSSWANNEVRYLQSGFRRLEKTATAEQKSIAESAVIEAEKLAAVSKLKDALPLEFAISSLWKNLDKTDALQRSNRRIEKLLIRCERKSKPDSDEIRAAAAVLNFWAGSIGTGLGINGAKSFRKQSETEFRRSETSRLRAIKLLDRLPSSDHQRRMAHRDLAVMYMAQNENELAEKEKQILFQLVGVADDSILMPKAGGCGQLVWWRHQTVSLGFLCGLG